MIRLFAAACVLALSACSPSSTPTPPKADDAAVTDPNVSAAAEQGAPIGSALAGTPTADTPEAVYEAYNRKVIEGMRSLEEDMQYYASAQRAEAEAKIAAQAQKAGKSRDEFVQMYLDFSRSAARCKDLTLVDKQVDGSKAVLTYKQRDTCEGNDGGEGTQQVTLVKENGWKIEAIDLSL